MAAKRSKGGVKAVKTKPQKANSPGAVRKAATQFKVGNTLAKGGARTAKTVRDALGQAFNRLGADDFLVRLGKSKAERRHLLPLLAKMIPTEVSGPDGKDIVIQIKEAARNV